MDDSRTLTFITSNPYKFEVGRIILEKAGITLVQEEIETPEIQSTEVSEIASFSARWAAERLNKPIILTDAGYYIEALNGFPGPFIKFVNNWLTADDLLRLVDGKEDRRVTVKMCLAYAGPGTEPITFSSEAHGEMSREAISSEKPGTTPINEIFIPDGFDKTDSQISREDMVKYWARTETYWQQLIDFLTRKNNP